MVDTGARGLPGRPLASQRSLPSTVGSRSTPLCAARTEKGSGTRGCGGGGGGSGQGREGLVHHAMGFGFSEWTEWNGPKAGEWPFLAINFKNNRLRIKQ